MSSDIVLNPTLVNKIQNYLNDPVYRETIENAASYNSRLSAERTMRLPFLDSQTGVAQNHSNLWMESRHRLPGLREGQIYTYPSKRWRKKRRQYLNNFMQPRCPPRKDNVEDGESQPAVSVESTSFPVVAGPSSHSHVNEDSKDSIKEETKQPVAIKDWYYDELDIPDAGEFEEPDADSDYDYEESYSKRKRKKATPKSARQTSARGRRKITYDPITDAEKPFACDLCGARYKTRPGLTYHYTHSHKDKEDEEEDEMVPAASPKRDESAARRHSRGSPATSLPPPVLHPQQQLSAALQPPTLQPQQPPPSHHLMQQMSSSGTPPPGPGMMPPPSQMMHNLQHHPPPPHLVPQQQPPPNHNQGPGMIQQLQPMPGTSGSSSSPTPPSSTPSQVQQTPPPAGTSPSLQDESTANGKKPPDNMKPRVQPSPYCDFCLGDAVENKKSGVAEELVSCSDCGRSGHPTCLQFTANMIISVKKYRWQCIECKCCSICGTSDNDDQLLFCDDCDRGYHMYCLSPPLDAPPEGSWSCTLCCIEFGHSQGGHK